VARRRPKPSIPEQTLRRIPRYHQILSELEARGEQFVSSRFLADICDIDDTQVRKDVSVIGYRGKPKAGYSVSGLKGAIGDFLGINYENTAILIGAGRLGSALAEYPGLAEYGLKLVAVFDSDPTKIGKIVGDHSVLPVESLSYRIGIAIVAVPKGAAQQVCDRVVGLGIKAIWNFAPTQLEVPDDVILRNENIAIGLAMLSHYVNTRKADTMSPESST